MLNRNARQPASVEALQRYSVKTFQWAGASRVSGNLVAAEVRRLRPEAGKTYLSLLTSAATVDGPRAWLSWPLKRFRNLTVARASRPFVFESQGRDARAARCRGFTLIELILVLALLVIITSIAAPAMARFIRGRALDTEARRMIALMHAAQSRAVSEGVPVMLWINEKTGAYGFTTETSGQNGDPKAEDLTLDSTLAVSMPSSGASTPTMFNNLPAIRFQTDGTVDENSPATLKLTDSDGFSRTLVETRLRTGYEVQ